MDLFPDLPGFDIEKSRATQFATTVQTSASGKEMRATFLSGIPRFEYSLKLNCARRADGFDVLQDEILAQLKCYDNARGKLNPLLFVDPVNGVVESPLDFGVGTGARTDYQLIDDEGWPATFIQESHIYAGGFVPGCARPWTFENGINPGLAWSIEDERPALAGLCMPSICIVTPGDTLSISAIGLVSIATTLDPNGYHTTTCGPDGGAYHGTKSLPSHRAGHTTSDSDMYGLVGAFADASGNVIQPIWIGSAASLVVPAGATRLQLGVNDYDHIDNAAGFWVTINSDANAFKREVQRDILVFTDGAPQDDKTEHTYTISDSGLISFDASLWGIIPPLGVKLSWSGVFARKVRFLDDSLSIKQLVKKLFSGDSIKLVSLK